MEWVYAALVVVLGIELKGWYLLAKEGEPSYRFLATADACAVHDLIVVVPWALNNVLSGSPVVFQPYIESAKYAAEYRNYHWQYLRKAKTDTSIKQPENIKPYPKKSDQISDEPVSDKGGNFGRFARTGIMDTYLEQIRGATLSGISAENWLSFFRIFADQRERSKINQEIEKLKKKVSKIPLSDANEEKILSFQRIISELEALLGSL